MEIIEMFLSDFQDSIEEIKEKKDDFSELPIKKYDKK